MASLENAVMFTFNGEETTVTPKIHVTFMKQLPTIFPKAKSRCPFRVATILVASSGTARVKKRKRRQRVCKKERRKAGQG